MKIIINIGHPAHVHFYRHAISALEKKGHEVLVTARMKEITYDLLDIYSIPYITQTKAYKTGLLGHAVEMIERDIKIYNLAKKFNPDILTGIACVHGAHVSKVTKASSIIFTDSEHSNLGFYYKFFASKIFYPFADVILTPSCFKEDLGKKQVRYRGYHEIAYLHPNYFKPNPEVLRELNLKKDEKFFILRFVSWKASHDMKQKGFSLEMKRKLVDELEKYGRVFITSEEKLPKYFGGYQLNVSLERVHDLLYYATMLIGDTQTMTTEAAVLGTPAIRCNSFVGPNDMGNFIELEKKYDLIYSFRDQNKALNKALELLKNPNLKREWAKKKERLLKDKIDVTKFMTEFIENYPESFYEYKNNVISVGHDLDRKIKK